MSRTLRQASRTRARSAGGSCEGVPPPKYTVSKGRGSRHVGAASSTSVTSREAKRWRAGDATCITEKSQYGQIAEQKARLAEVIALQEEISAERMAARVGRIEEVLLHAQSKRRKDELVGRTGSFKAVVVPRGDRAPGDLVRVRIERSTSATLFGTVVA